MSSRLDRLVDNSLQALIEAMQSDVRELRSRQSIPKALTRKAYQTVNPGSWDITGIPVGSPAANPRTVNIIWVSDGSQPAPTANLALDVFNTSSGAHLNKYGQYDNSNGGATKAVGPVTVGSVNSLGGKTFTWTVIIQAPVSSSATYNVKASVLGSTPGVLTVSLVP